MAFVPGETVGPYRIIAPLGRGGMATVFKAYHTTLDRDVAIKVLHSNLGDNRNFLERFKREAKIVGKLNHSNIVPVYDFSEEGGQPYLVMMYVEGHTLKDEMKQGPMPLERVLEVMHAVGDALSYAHAQGVLHRDIKPTNVMITHDNKIYLTDFGLAKMTEASETSLSRDMMIGTPHYISPEQAQSQTLDRRADVYSLGAMLFEMLSGYVPFQGDTPYEVIHQHIYNPPPSPRSVNAEVPHELEYVILRALQKKPSDRYSSVQEMLDDLEKAVSTLMSKRAKRKKKTAKRAPKPKPKPQAPTPSEPQLSTLQTRTTTSQTMLSPEFSRLKSLPEEGIAEKAKEREKSNGGGWMPIFIMLLFILIAAAGAGAVLWFTPQGRNILTQVMPIAQRDRAEELAQEAYEHARERDWNAAEAAYREAIELDSSYTDAHLGLGDVLLAEGLETGGSLDEALIHYQIVLEKDPKNVGALMRSGQAKFYQKDWAASAQYFERLLDMGQDSAWAHVSLGRKYLHEGNTSEAQRELEQALQMDAELPEAHYAMGVLYSVIGQPDAARNELQQILNSGRANAWLHRMVEQEMQQLGG